MTTSTVTTDGSPRDGVAVVLVTHNGERHLEEQVRSILDQTLPPQRVYLVDDRSTDRSLELVSRLMASRTDIELERITGPNRPSADLFTRIASNFSAGMAASAGWRYIALSDQDDVWEPNRLARHRERLLRTGALVTVGNGELVDDSGAATGRTLRDAFPVLPSWPTAEPEHRFRSVLRAPMATGAAMMLDSQVLDRALPIPHGWLHDRWLSLVAAALDALDVDDHPVIRYRLSHGQAVGLSGETNKSTRGHLLAGLRAPALAIRKIGHLSHRLRPLAANQQIRRQLSPAGLIVEYGSRRTH